MIHLKTPSYCGLFEILPMVFSKSNLLILISDPAAHVKRKKAGGFRGEIFSEGYDVISLLIISLLHLYIAFSLFSLSLMHYQMQHRTTMPAMILL